MPSRLSSKAKRIRDRVIGRRLADVPVKVESLNSELIARTEITSREIRELADKIDQVADAQNRLYEKMDREFERQLQIGQAILNREPENRERLLALRRSKDYERPFTETDPLVSVLIATYRNLEALEKVSLPSILSQEYENFEVIIVGDNAPEETAEIISGFNDSRLTFLNLNRRGPYPSTRHHLWQVAGGPPFNHALERATGLWFAPFSDDDRMRKNHLIALVNEAQEKRYEICYGRFEQHDPGGVVKTFGTFPPAATKFAMQGSICHIGLRYFELDLHSWMFDFPSDMNWLLKLLRAGAIFGMIDETVVDYYPSLLHERHDGVDADVNRQDFELNKRVFEAFDNQR